MGAEAGGTMSSVITSITGPLPSSLVDSPMDVDDVRWATIALGLPADGQVNEHTSVGRHTNTFAASELFLMLTSVAGWSLIVSGLSASLGLWLWLDRGVG